MKEERVKYRVIYSKHAAKAMSKIPIHVMKRLRVKIMQLAEDPHASNQNVKRLKGRTEFRLRMGNWRVIYGIQDARLVIFVIKIAKREESYK